MAIGPIVQRRGSATWKGTAYACTPRALSNVEVDEYLPEGARNAAEADPRAFAFSVSAFAGPRPEEGDTLTWQGADYTIARAYITPLGSTWRCLCFRTPLPASATTEGATEPNPGQRKPYYPPPNIH